MNNITLTDDQQAAVHALTSFLVKDNEHAFVLEGYAGTGKSTLVHYILDNIQKILATVKLIKPDFPHYEVELTATTNKAAENLASITAREVKTIHSFLGLRVQTDYKTRETSLVEGNRHLLVEHAILFIDEASYIDSDLLTMIFKKTKNCKVVFIGDPAQLIPVKAKKAPVFSSGFPKASLTKVMRQAQGNPILDLATMFRETVSTLQWGKFTPDGKHIQYLPREEFNQAIKQEFTRPDWRSQESKVLAWTNKTVEAYNKGISAIATGQTSFQVGDYAQCNKYFQSGKQSIKTDELVLITAIGFKEVLHGVSGRFYTINHHIRAFCPDDLAAKKALHRIAKSNDNWDLLSEIEERWIDLRTVYACTINKSQGSTYDRVFIDLDDLKKINSGESLARLLYVASSRPRHQLIFTGDLV